MFPTVYRMAYVLIPPPRSAAPPMFSRAPTRRSTAPAEAAPAPRLGLTMLSAGDMDMSVYAAHLATQPRRAPFHLLSQPPESFSEFF